MGHHEAFYLALFMFPLLIVMKSSHVYLLLCRETHCLKYSSTRSWLHIQNELYRFLHTRARTFGALRLRVGT